VFSAPLESCIGNPLTSALPKMVASTTVMYPRVVYQWVVSHRVVYQSVVFPHLRPPQDGGQHDGPLVEPHAAHVGQQELRIQPALQPPGAHVHHQLPGVNNTIGTPIGHSYGGSPGPGAHVYHQLPTET